MKGSLGRLQTEVLNGRILGILLLKVRPQYKLERLMIQEILVFQQR